MSTTQSRIIKSAGNVKDATFTSVSHNTPIGFFINDSSINSLCMWVLVYPFLIVCIQPVASILCQLLDYTKLV